MSSESTVETIMCVRAKDFKQFTGELNNGFTPSSEKDIKKTLNKCGIWFGPRETLENDENFWQIIPYVVLRYNKKMALYSRTESSGENRLHNKYSIGFGGHINLTDLNMSNGSAETLQTIRIAAEREVFEEVKCEGLLSRQFLGLLRDDLTPVSRVHLGLVEIWDINNMNIRSNEDSINNPVFVSKKELEKKMNQLETWSQHIVKSFDDKF